MARVAVAWCVVWLGAATSAAAQATPPRAESVLPASGTGTSQRFDLQYADDAGAATLTRAWVWFTETFAPSAALSCLVYYDRPSHTLALIDDTGTVWHTAPFGAATVLQNARCAIDVAATTVTLSGETLALSLPVVFDARAEGTKTVYLYAASTGGVSDWQARGSWTVPAPVVRADAVTPAGGSGTVQTFTLQYADTAGASAVTQAWVWFTETFASTAELSCLVYYDRPSHTLALIDDTGSVWQTAPPGTATLLRNARCAIDVAATMVTLSGETLILSLPVTFDARADGTKTIFLYGAGASGVSGWQARGSWTVPAPTPAIRADAVTPASGSGTAQTFTLQYADTSGAGAITQAWVWFNTRFAGTSAQSCLVYYEPVSNRLHLVNDAATAWLSATAGAPGALQNSQCAIVPEGVAASLDGERRTLTLPVVFAPGYAGAKSIYLYAAAGFARTSGWHRRGAWTVAGGDVSLTADRPSPQLAGTAIAWTAAVDPAASPEYRFWQWDGSVWTVLRDWSADGTVVWTPPGPGDYRLAVWVRTHGSALDAPQRYTSATFRIDPKVSGAVLTVAPSSSQTVGTAVTLGAAASGGLAPYQFQFRVQDASGAWTILRDWSASASATWIPWTVGTYTLAVHVRSSGASGNTSEAADYRAFTVVPNCTPNTTDGPLYVPESGGNSALWIDVHPSCAWAGLLETAWLEFASASAGYGPGAVIVRATPNGGETREGRVAFGGRPVAIVQQGVDTGTCTWSMDDRGKTFDANTHEASVFVNAPADCQWTARASGGGGFVRLGGSESRTGPGTVWFTVENNTTTTLRRAALELDGRLVLVTQYGIGGGADPPGCSYSVTPEAPAVGPGNGQHRVWVATGSGCAWTAEGGAWLHPLNGLARSGPGWLDYAVENNTAADARTGVMTVAGRTVPVTQPPVDGCDYAVDPASLSVSSGNHAGRVSVSANPGCAWSAERTGTFLHLPDTVSGVGAGVVDYAIENNTTLTPRAGTLRIAGITIPVSQLAVGDCTYQVTPAEEALDSGNHARTLSVSTRADCAWTAVSASGFLAVSGAGLVRTGPGEVRYTAENNTSPEPRTGLLHVAGTPVTVTQLAAGDCTIALDPSARTVGAGGETFTLAVLTAPGCPWQASTPTPSIVQLWGALTQTGPGSVEVEVENHTSFAARTGTVHVGGQTLTLWQAGVCEPTVQPLDVTVPASAGEGFVDVTTGDGCAWTAVSAADFLHVLPYSGVGPDSLRFAYDANLTDAARTGTLSVAGHTVTVTQPAATDPAGAFDPSRDVVRYYHTDAVGSVRMITDAAGQVVARYDYLPFGEEWSPPAFRDPRLFAGTEHDEQTGLDYFGARYYSSRIGRFTTVDPVLDIEQAILNPQLWNRYAYSLSNPLQYVDPDGRQAWIAWVHNIVNSPAVQRVSQAVTTQAANLSMAAMRLLGSPVTPELSQAMAELATGAELPGGLPATGAARLLPLEVAENFVGPVHRFVARSDLTAFRFWAPGSASRELGQWLTTESTVARIASPQDAIAALSLSPSGNMAKALSKIQIKKGTEVFAGRVRNGAGWATQLWIRDREGLRLLGQIDEYGFER